MSEDDTLDLWLEGHFAGQLHRGEAGQVEFLYDPDYLGSSRSPVSLSMPRSQRAHGPSTAGAWIENLVPEPETVREAWARRFAEQRTDAFALLRHSGVDAPGAVQILPEGLSPDQAVNYQVLTERDLAARLRHIRDTGEAWVPGANDNPRFSLAGQQAKFAVARVGDDWLEPDGRAASTHIFKPGMQGMGLPSSYNDEQATEFITMRAARHLGLSVAAVDLLQFEDTYAFVTKRYDRVTTADGKVVRVHQEDVCQALAVPPGKKYEADGGPSVAQTAQLLGEYSAAPHRDLQAFAEALVFNYLVAGIDGHGKNYSLVVGGDQVRLSPAYDLISAYGILDQDTIKHKVKMGMRYGKEYRLGSIDGRNLVRTADALGVNRAEFFGLIQRLGEAIPEQFARASDQLPGLEITDRVRALPEVIAQSVASQLQAITSAALETPKWEPLVRTGSPGNTLWEPGHARSGRWVTGHYVRRRRSR